MTLFETIKDQDKKLGEILLEKKSLMKNKSSM